MYINRLFIVLFSLNLLNYIDRQVLYAVFPLIKEDLSLSDFQLGTFASVFIITYLLCAPVIGFFADRSSRTKWVGLTACLWSMATLGCASAYHYVTLLISRSFIGVGEAGFTAIAQPLLAEQYPKEKHSSVLALFGLAFPLGSALGYMIGGMVGHHWGWRLAFILAGIPGVFLGLYALTKLKDTRILPATASALPRLSNYLTLLKNKPFLWVCLAQAMITFLIGGFAAWVPMYLHRYLQMDPAQAGFVMGILIIVSGACGTYLGGKLAEKLLKHTKYSYFWVLGGSLACVLPTIWIGLLVTHLPVILACFALTIFFLFLPTGAIAAALVATSAPHMRSMAFALNIFIIHLLGDALSPMLMGYISDMWSLKMSFLIGSFMAIPAIYFVYLGAKNFSKNPAN
jgi:MFS family permease